MQLVGDAKKDPNSNKEEEEETSDEDLNLKQEDISDS